MHEVWVSEKVVTGSFLFLLLFPRKCQKNQGFTRCVAWVARALLFFLGNTLRKEVRTMATVRKTVRTGVAAVLLLGGLTTGAQGLIGAGGADFGPGGGWGIQIRGKMVCTQCSLSEVRKAQPYNSHLYQLSYRQEQGVMDVGWVSNPRWWNHLTVPRLRVRGADSLWQKLTAEEHLFTEVELTGRLSPSQVLDMRAVTIRG